MLTWNYRWTTKGVGSLFLADRPRKDSRPLYSLLLHALTTLCVCLGTTSVVHWLKSVTASFAGGQKGQKGAGVFSRPL